MDDLDRLLADLEASTSQFKSPSSKPGPPPEINSQPKSPLSPIYSEIPGNVNGNHPPQESEPIYEAQPDRQLPPSQDPSQDPSHLYAKPHQTFTQHSPLYNSGYQPTQSTNSAPPPKPARTRPGAPPTVTTTTAYPFPDTTRTHQESKMDNLSELDSLLADLESAQVKIQNERARQVSATSPKPFNPPSPSKGPPPTTAPKPRKPDEPRSPTGQAPGYQYSQPPSQEAPQLLISQPPTRTASSATKELDDLMASLSDFQVSSPQPTPTAVRVSNEPSYAKPHQVAPTSPSQPTQGVSLPPKGVQLDSMLGHLESDVSRQGVSMVAKGFCAACQKQIIGQIVTALGATWHPEHFVCSKCDAELGTKSFFEREGQAYCEADYQEMFSPRCAYCNGPILDKCVTALDKTWHPEHFFCAQCGQPFGDGGFHEKNNKVYCKEDYFDMFAPKCGGCHRAIMENYITALNVQWHPECFVCGDCRQPFNGGSFFDHDSVPYCEIHYHAVRGSLCAGCSKPITGRCITAMQRKFHPEHFICAFCLKQLNKGTFKEQNDKPYCHACFIRLFG